MATQGGELSWYRVQYWLYREKYYIQYWYCTGKYWQGTGGSIGYTGGVGVTVGERIAGEVICEVAVGKKYKSRKTYNCEVVER